MHRLERWRPLIQGATTEEQLLTVMHEYCGSWLPSELAKIPPNCPACRVEAIEDITSLALDYTAYELKYQGPDEVAALLRDLALVFTAAAQQLKRITPSPLA